MVHRYTRSRPRPTAPRLALSGHSHRVQLFASLISLPLDLVDVDMMNGEHKTPRFLALNSFGQVPVLQDGDVTLADSNAILVYLEGRYAPGRWLPRDPLATDAGEIPDALLPDPGEPGAR